MRMTDAARDKEFIEYVVKMLVDKPELVKVDRKIDEMGVLITLDVHADDMGMVIGREGMTAKALRTLLRVIGARNNARVNLKINEPEGSTRGRREFAPAESAPAGEAAPAAPATASALGVSEPASAPSTPRTFEDVMNDIKI